MVVLESCGFKKCITTANELTLSKILKNPLFLGTIDKKLVSDHSRSLCRMSSCNKNKTSWPCLTSASFRELFENVFLEYCAMNRINTVTRSVVLS